MPDSIINSIAEVKKSGYEYEFKFHEGKLVNRETKKAYLRNQFSIDKEMRIEGYSDPADASILFAITCYDGTKGHFSSAYGIYADTELFDFLKE